MLDLETDGFGPAVSVHDKAKEPTQILCILYGGAPQATPKRRDFWGTSAIDDAFAHIIASRRNAVIYAHFGGAFDFRFAFPRLFKTDSRWKLVTVGSIVLSATGRFATGFTLRLVDSIRLLPSSLRKIGDAIKCPKLDIDVSNLGTLLSTEDGRKQVADYCFRDCFILYDALKAVTRKFVSLGVDTKTTLASTATSYVRKGLNRETVAWSPSVIDNEAEYANFGGRVEVFRAHCEAGEIYDIQSSYPRAMLESLPWRYQGSAIGRRRTGSGILLAKIRVESDTEIPVLPFRIFGGPESGRIYFPTGVWEGWYTTRELDYAESIGACRILKVRESHIFAESTVLRDFALEAWAERASAKAEDPDGFDAYFWKIYLNSCYGKLSEKKEKELVLVNPERLHSGLIPKAPSLGIYAKPVHYEPGFRHVVTGATITAVARIRLHAFAMEALRRGGRVYYCDTDSLTVSHCTLPTGKELGDLTREHSISNGVFLGAKLYSYEDTCHGARFVAKGKGFPFPRGDKPAEQLAARAMWDTLESHEPVEFERRQGFKEALNRGEVGYKNLRVTRRQRNPKPKRKIEGDYSRPWDVRELVTE